ncbi:hypothetical protein GCM10010967_54360 [Dyadobacter beijingensis]|uniref:PKD domain-containing protein n=1 Tax=Dyadobacter beijingensis TaxID=365489 RepID=A0ABQ2IHM0_9BACT|nr:PKD domain-containing protein [Dyadobacter beijingensis]GGN11570.1 hypothetical protein GCM10010967_54360 [Dyadobacter beijingensis]
MKRIFTYILLTLIVVACHIESPQTPVAQFRFTPEGGCTFPCTVKFTSESENAASIQWDFGDGVKHTDLSVEHKFSSPGTYYVKLIVKGVDGGSSGITQMVHVDTVKPFSLSGDNNFPTDIISDNNGNIYVSGTAKGQVDFGEQHKFTSKGGDDFFVAKFDSTGQCLWLYSDGSVGNDHGNAIVLDKENNVYLTGFVAGTVSNWNNRPRGGVDGFVVKIDGKGKSDWVKTFGGPLDDQGRSLAFFQAGEGPNLYLVGTIEGDNVSINIDFDSNHQTQANGRDGFLALINTDDKQFTTVKTISGPDIQAPETVAVDDQGNAYIAGAFLKSIQIPGKASIQSVDSVDVFVAKWGLIPQNFLWAQRAGSPGVDFAYDIVVDRLRNVFVTGMHSGTFKDLPLQSDGDENVYLGKWDTNGNVLKARNGFTNGVKDYHGGIALTDKGNIVIAGSFTNSAQFPMSRGRTISSNGGTDIIITEVDAEELYQAGNFAARAGGVLEDRVNKICVTKEGFVYATGWFYGNAPYKNVELRGTSGVRNTFIVRYKL